MTCPSYNQSQDFTPNGLGSNGWLGRGSIPGPIIEEWSLWRSQLEVSLKFTFHGVISPKKLTLLQYSYTALVMLPRVGMQQ